METVTAVLNLDALRKARKKARLVARDAAARVGVTTGTITNIENGIAGTTPERLAALARVYKVQMETLFFFEENNDNTVKPIDK